MFSDTKSAARQRRQPLGIAILFDHTTDHPSYYLSMTDVPSHRSGDALYIHNPADDGADARLFDLKRSRYHTRADASADTRF
jgi:hypothetical protein